MGENRIPRKCRNDAKQRHDRKHELGVLEGLAVRMEHVAVEEPRGLLDQRVRFPAQDPRVQRRISEVRQRGGEAGSSRPIHELPTNPKAATSPMMNQTARLRPVDQRSPEASDSIDCVGVVISTGRHCCLSNCRTLNAQHVRGPVKVLDARGGRDRTSRCVVVRDAQI